MQKFRCGLVVVFLVVFVSCVFGGSSAIEEGGHGEGVGLGAELPVWSVIPFVGILLSIAIFPLVAPDFWHHHFGKISAAWAIIFAVPFLLAYQGEAMHEILHIYFADYIPFIILLLALFTVAGGIHLKGALWGSPLSNTLMLVIGTAIASWIGTTGAAMLMIRPVLRMNRVRTKKVHIVVFFIFLVSNIGGSLTPLGDPPLFLGFLHGVPFFWTLNLFPPMIIISVMLFLLFFLIDSLYYRREGFSGKGYGLMSLRMSFEDEHSGTMVFEETADEPKSGAQANHMVKKEKLEVEGLINLLFLAGVLVGVLFSGYVKLGWVSVLGIDMRIEFIIRDLFLLLMVFLSVRFTSKQVREDNEFTWFPIKEVAILFAGIFMTIIPALEMLKAGKHGHLAFIIEAVRDPWHYFWITGSLSSFLDNAPTYLTFFNTALGSLGLTEEQIAEGLRLGSEGVAQLSFASQMQQFVPLLLAISTGAVFFGAVTYIGNAPNFMVKSIAEENGIPMPTFFGYMLWSVAILFPLFLIITWIFFL